MASFKDAPEVARIGRELIEAHHVHLLDTPLVYRFRKGKWNSKGKEVWGTASKVGGINAFEMGEVEAFRILINEGVWAGLTQEQKLALVDHELSHCVIEYDEDGVGELAIVGHDVEDFRDIIERHGFWNFTTVAFAETCVKVHSRPRQLKFSLETNGVRTEELPVSALMAVR